MLRWVSLSYANAELLLQAVDNNQSAFLTLSLL